jgi:protoporphyrin/coproporphyrin ferrochelatase
MRTGVILFNLGGPERLSEVRPFLYNLFSDPEIIRTGIPALRKPLAWLISTVRTRKSSGYYSLIGGGSPLRKITDAQAHALEQELVSMGLKARVYVAMRYWHPFTHEAIDDILNDQITDLVVLPLYPQFSVSTTGSSIKEMKRLLDERGGVRQMRRRYITRWYDRPDYISVVARQIENEISLFPDPRSEKVHLLFSAHSVPQSYIERGDPYLRQTQETMRLVCEKLGNSSPTSLSFQSKVGPVKWLEPSTNDALRQLRERGVEQVLTIPISFVSDHIETLYELDILYRNRAKELGFSSYRRVPALNCEPKFIRALAGLVVESLGRRC